MSKVLKIAGEVIVGAALVAVTAGAALAVAGGFSIAAGVGAVAAGATSLIGIGLGSVLAIGAGLTLAGGLLAKKPSISPAQVDRTKVSLVLDAPRTMVFGHTALGTDLRWQLFWGAEQEYVSQVLAVASHWCESIDQVWLNDQLGWDAGSGTQSAYSGYFFVATNPRATPGSGYTDGSDGLWGAANAFAGCATIHLQYRVLGLNDKAGGPFSSSIPTRVTIRGKGARVYDPRLDSTAGGSGAQLAADQSTWAFAPGGVENGRNPALCLLFYLLGWRIQNPVTGAWKLAVGCGIPVDRIDLASFMTAANLCDEPVTLTAGGTEPRYRCDGMFSEADDPSTVITALEASMNAKLRDSDGRFALQVFHNDLSTPIVDFTDDDVLDDFTWDAGAALNDLKNVIRGRYTNASDASLYQLVDYPPVSLPSLDGIDRTDSFDLALVQSPSQAQRLAKQRLERYQYPGTFAANFKAKAWAVKDGDVVRLTFSALGMSQKLFRVTKATVQVTGVVPLVLAEENVAIYAWDSSESPAVVAAAPMTFDPLQEPIRLAIDDAAETAEWTKVSDNKGKKPDDNAVNTRNSSAPFGNSTVGYTLDALGRVSVQVGDIDQVKSDLSIARIDLDNAIQLAGTREAEMLARTTLAGQDIGTVVAQQVTRIDSAVESINLMGAKNADGTAFNFNVNTVLVDDNRTLAQWVSSLSATSSDGSTESQAQQLQQAITDGDSANAKSISQVSTNLGKLASQVSFVISARADTNGNQLAQGILSLDVNGRVAGMIASNTGSLSTLDLVFDRTRLLRPDGTLLLRAGDTNSGQDGNAVYMPNVIVDTLEVNTAMIPVRAVAADHVAGSYGSSTGVASPRSAQLTAVVSVPRSGWVEATAKFQQGLVGANGPWSAAIAMNGVEDSYSNVGGGVEQDSVLTQGAFYCSGAGNYTVTLQQASVPGIEIRERSLFIKFFPGTR